MKAMILAAGIGSRLKPLTDKTPKALVKIGDYRMIDLCMAWLLKHGITDFIVNAHHYADQIMEWVVEKKWEGYNVEVSFEEELLNTGGGLVKASPFFKGEEDFVLTAVDILTDLDLKSMIEQHKRDGNLVTLAVKSRETSRNLLFDKEGLLAGWKHKETQETKEVKGRNGVVGLGFSGVHVINKKLFSLIQEKGAFSIIDLYLRLAADEHIGAFDHSGGDWIEFGRAERIKELVETDTFKKLIADVIE